MISFRQKSVILVALLDTQIIISREDNTDFLSLGYIQTDTSLVSALGGALTNFAEEIGLGGNDVATNKRSKVNFSRFPNGILASKMVPVGDNSPIILIAIKGFEGADRELDFIIEYAEELAKAIVTKFVNEYTSIGIIPQIDDAYDVITSVANKTYRKSIDKSKSFTKNFNKKIVEILNNIWDDQEAFESWTRSFSSKRISIMTQTELEQELAKYFYIQGAKDDALFPLVYGVSGKPIAELSKTIRQFLDKKASAARKEILSYITKIYTQLKDSSNSLSKRGVIEIPEVELINEASVFEKIKVTKKESLEKVVASLNSATTKELYKKLFLKHPLKFAAMSKDSIFDKSELNKYVSKTYKDILKDELTNNGWISEKILSILRRVISSFSPNDVLKQENKILSVTFDEYLDSLKKEHPFVVLADPTFSKLTPIIKSKSKELLETFRTSTDEAVVLYNVIGQIHSIIATERADDSKDLMLIYFLQKVIEPYQFREVPVIVYALVNECLANTNYGKRYNSVDIANKSINQLEKKLAFQVVPTTKKIITNRLSKAKITSQKFETFENLSFFFKSFRSSLENTLSRILQTIFGPEKYPSPPNDQIRLINEIAVDLQSVFTIKTIIDRISKRPSGRELFSLDAVKTIEAQTKFKHILPTPMELAVQAYASGWLKPLNKKKESKITANQLKQLKVRVSSVGLEGIVEELLLEPNVIALLWTRFAPKIIEKRQKELKEALANYEKHKKVTVGDTTGKKKFGAIVKQLKSINKAITNVVSGGGIMRKIFTSGKDLSQLTTDASKQLAVGLSESIDKLADSPQYLKNNITIDPLIGDFQDLMMTYASIWIADSEFIDKLENKLFWEGVLKSGNGNDSSQLSRQIYQNLKSSYKKDRKDQNAVIRNTIVEEVVPLFSNNIRITMEQPYKAFKDERIVKFDEKTNDWYISCGKLNMPINNLRAALKDVKHLQLLKLTNETTEIRLTLTHFYALKRTKEPQTIEEFIRKALFNILNKREIKALEFFGDLYEKYIGKASAEVYYNNLNSLAQIILTPV